MRGTLLRFANTRWARRLATGKLGRRVSLRFVAGSDLEDGLRVAKALNARGMKVSLDHLGEHVRTLEAARGAVADYLRGLDRIAEAGLDANVSIKLTQLGIDLDEAAALDNAEEVVSRAVQAGTTVTLDMEDHRYTDRTVEACLELQRRHPGGIGLAIQSYLYRTPKDLERTLAVQVRLCKGAYLEQRDVAYRTKEEVDREYAHLARRLVEAGRYPMFATHDERLVRFVKRQAEKAGRAKDTFEFQMLYGIRRDLQERLVADGYRVRVYVPYGTEWYPYLIRRLAERPANAVFFLRELFRG